MIRCPSNSIGNYLNLGSYIRVWGLGSCDRSNLLETSDLVDRGGGRPLRTLTLDRVRPLSTVLWQLLLRLRFRRGEHMTVYAVLLQSTKRKQTQRLMSASVKMDSNPCMHSRPPTQNPKPSNAPYKPCNIHSKNLDSLHLQRHRC